MRPIIFLLVCSTLAGAAGALGAVLFRETLRGLEWLLLGAALGPQQSLVYAATRLPIWQRILAPALGGLVAGVTLHWGARFLRDDQPSDYLEAVRHGTGQLSVRATLVRAFSSLWSVASGGSLGREGSMVQVSATCGSVLAAWTRLSAEDRHTVVASAAAAGLATAYNAPLAASLFVAELGLGSIRMGKLAPILLASVIGNEFAHLIFDAQPIFNVPNLTVDGGRGMLLALTCGLAAGVFGPFYLAVFRRVRALFSGLGWRPPARLTLGGLLVGLLSALEPRVWGNGYSVTHSLLNDSWLPAAAAGVLVAKVLATACTTGSGAVGGMFTPTLLVGASLGTLVGAGLVAPQAGAVLGMGALLAATTHAPVMAILMILEMTGDQKLTLPVAAACVIAYAVARSLGSESLYGEPE